MKSLGEISRNTSSVKVFAAVNLAQTCSGFDFYLIPSHNQEINESETAKHRLQENNLVKCTKQERF